MRTIPDDSKCERCGMGEPLKIKVGHLRHTCAACVQAIRDEGGCPICLATMVSQEHMDECAKRRGRVKRKKSEASSEMPELV